MQNSRKGFFLLLQLVRNQLGNPDKRFQKLIIDVNVALILRQVSFSVGLVEHSPMLGLEVQGVLSTLKNEIATFRPEASAS
jgi:hypothetical protein